MSNIWTMTFGILIGIPKQSWTNKLVIGPAFFGLYTIVYTFIVNEWEVRKLKRDYRKLEDNGEQVIPQEDFDIALSKIREMNKPVFYLIGFFQKSFGAAIVAGITSLIANFFRG